MYRCKKCGNKIEFEEINVIKTYVNLETKETSDEFFYRETVICLEFGSTLEDGDVEETNEEF